MLTEPEALACFDYICSCQKAHRCICQHFTHKPSLADAGVTLLSMTKMAIAIAKSDWDSNFSGKEDMPRWRNHDWSTYVEQIVDIIMENKGRFL